MNRRGRDLCIISSSVNRSTDINVWIKVVGKKNKTKGSTSSALMLVAPETWLQIVGKKGQMSVF